MGRHTVQNEKESKKYQKLKQKCPIICVIGDFE